MYYLIMTYRNKKVIEKIMLTTKNNGNSEGTYGINIIFQVKIPVN